ncbi:ABC transporter ATP-binding protein [Mordavella massiliensis]|uniref:ABC transporter ATP-binding protein n=1 Tax=Mordavella massiliensis TaxID=1871024 RepID=A0A938X9Z0_9CLOT|nr:ABC transporter ATP-binding protein [Mordavella massiliensis]MBM6947631.1 ABC transporter ATP-binding protein [Mordavella massiliensis]
MEAVRVQELRKSYRAGSGSAPVLLDVTFSLEEGSFTALAGISGSGKTTLLHLLAGLQEPDSGRMLLLGRDMGGMNEKERILFRRRHVSLVLQEAALLPSLTVEENLVLPVIMDTGKLVDREKLEAIRRDLALGGVWNRYPAQLSGGERQRAVFGRALFSDAEIILADEPCARLDRRQSLETMGLLKRCAGLWGRTVLMATHDLDLAQICDRILTLREGKIR